METFYNVMGKTHFTIARNIIEIAITNIQDFYEGNCKIITTGHTRKPEWKDTHMSGWEDFNNVKVVIFLSPNL